MDSEQQGLTFRINEPASRPRSPKGPQYFHIAVAGFLLSIGLPLGGLFAFVKLDPRVRLASAIEQRFRLPVYAVMPQVWTPGEVVAVRHDVSRLLVASGATVAVIAVFFVLNQLRVL